MTNEEVINGLGKIELVIYPDGTQVQEFVSYEKQVLQALQNKDDEWRRKIEEFETQIRLETLKEVLPNKAEPTSDVRRGYNMCIREIINKAKENWDIEL